MFRCFHVFEPSRSFTDWRKEVCGAHQEHNIDQILVDFLRINKAEALIFSSSGERLLRPTDLFLRHKTYFLYEQSRGNTCTVSVLIDCVLDVYCKCVCVCLCVGADRMCTGCVHILSHHVHKLTADSWFRWGSCVYPLEATQCEYKSVAKTFEPPV